MYHGLAKTARLAMASRAAVVEYFSLVKCVSLWPAAREAARQTASKQSPVLTHSATIHHCPPPTSTSLLPSILSFLIRSSHPRRLLSARSHNSRPATSTGALLIVVSSTQRGNRPCPSTHSTTMINCATCQVNTIDRLCTNTPRTCYQCCTSRADILTCPFHYQQMGISDAAARLAGGLVHPSITEEAETGAPSAPARRHSAPPGESDPQDGVERPQPAAPPPIGSPRLDPCLCLISV